MTRGKQSVKKGIWYLGKKKKNKNENKKRQQGKGFPIGLMPLHHYQVKQQNLYLKQFLLEEEKKDDERKNTAEMTGCSQKRYINKRTNLLQEVRKNKLTKFTEERYNKKKQKKWTKAATD